MAHFVAAIGSLATGGWIGFVHDDEGYHLACSAAGGGGADGGGADGGLTVSPGTGVRRTEELLLVAIAHYEDALAAPPSELEATQADLAALLRWVAAAEPDPRRRSLLDEVVDSVDDGLPADAVVARLTRTLDAISVERGRVADDPDALVRLLLARCPGGAELSGAAGG